MITRTFIIMFRLINFTYLGNKHFIDLYFYQNRGSIDSFVFKIHLVDVSKDQQ